MITNAMTIDVEDYFHVSAFEGHVTRDKWTSLESRVCANTERILELFREFDVRGTFFVLGCVAERFPGLVRTIADEGHEVASHGFAHRLIGDQTPSGFRADITRTKALLESLTGRPVRGYRAPSYSVTPRTLWALDILIEEGHEYDASIFPIHHDRYGIPRSPRHPYVMRRPSGTLVEAPGSTVALGPINVPIAGGGYFRQFPYWWTQWGITRVNTVEQRPVFFYLHPWEIDPDQPRLPGGVLSQLRHYRNLHDTERRLRQLLTEFSFGPLSAVLATAGNPQLAGLPAWTLPYHF